MPKSHLGSLAAMIIVSSLLASGCSLTLGDTFKKHKVPYGMSMIYVYAGKDLTANQNAHVDTTPETPDGTDSILVVKEGYYPYLVSAGTTVRVFTGDPEAGGTCVQFLAQENAANYIRVRTRDDEALVEWMDPQTALPEVGNTREMSKEVKRPSSATYPVGKCLPI